MQLSGAKVDKTLITFFACSNGSRGDKVPMCIIARAIGRKTGHEIGFAYRHNSNVCMTMSFFFDWFHRFDARFKNIGRKVYPLMDGHLRRAQIEREDRSASFGQ